MCLILCVTTEAVPALALGSLEDRPDRLVTISGSRPEELVAEYSEDGGKTWNPATVFVGTTIDEWRPCDAALWNRAALEGRIPAGDQECLWNYFFDVKLPAPEAYLRIRKTTGEVVVRETVAPADSGVGCLIDRRNVAELAGGQLPAPWCLRQAGKKSPPADSIFCPIDDPVAPPLVLKPKLIGWHRIYVAMEPYSAFLFSLSKEDVHHPVPDYLASSSGSGRDRYMQEFYVKSADLTGQDIHLAIGGVRQNRRDASIRHVRFVPMTADETARWHKVRELARTQGRPFVGYMEQVTPAHYEPSSLTLLQHTRNEMRLHRDRGSTDVYVHVIRLGIRAWYHSDVVERGMIGSEQEHWEAVQRTCAVFPKGGARSPKARNWQPAIKWAEWMKQGDPLAVAIEEGRAVGLKVFADMGMNVTHIIDAPQATERTVVEHPEYLSDHPMFLDYRKEGVQDYAVSVARELLSKYDVDGINLDFARWGYKKAYDEPSLVAVVRRIHEARLQAQAKHDHPMLIAVRIPSYMYGKNSTYTGEHPWFVSALRTWARKGWIDRIMPCVDYSRAHEFSMARYKEAIVGTRVTLWGDLYWQGFDTPRSHHMAIARKWVKEGLDGGFFFYAHHRPTEFERINWMLRLIDSPEIQVEP